MKNVILLLALLALTQAKFEEQLFEVESDYYDATAWISADIGYQTLYTAGADAAAMTQSYALDFYGFFKIYIAQQVAEVYSNELIFNFYPFDVVIYRQDISVARIDNNNAFSMTFMGSRDIKLGYLYTNVIENAKVCGFSFVDLGFETDMDNIMDGMTCGYSPYTVEDYKDAYWTVDLGNYLLGLNTASWYGMV